ncbi:MAG: translation initiation factor aIF-1A [Ignisphaera sp.]|uniref:Translation initiation factor 1A n=1 Tax=Ignisphaera aggregans TaxID=334771 RepID=A0A7C4NNW2_9CREN
MSKKKAPEEQITKSITLPGEGQVICVVEEVIGADHVKVRCMDGVSRVCRIPGKFRRKTWISEGNVVLVAPWDFQPNKGDIIHRYEKDEIKKLVNMNMVSREFIEGGE